MEYSLKEVRKITKQTLLTKKEVFELYQELYEDILDAARKFGSNFVEHFVPNDHEKFNVYEDVLRVFTLDGFNTKQINNGHDTTFYINWENLYETDYEN